MVTGHLGDSEQRFGRVVDLTRDLTGCASPGDLLDVMVAAARADGGYIAVPARDARLELVACVQGPGQVDDHHVALGLREVAPRSSAATAVLEGRSVWVSTRAEGERLFPEVTALLPWVQAWVALPLIARSVAFGVVVLAFAEELEFVEPDRRTLESMATVCSLAMGAPRPHSHRSARGPRHPRS